MLLGDSPQRPPALAANRVPRAELAKLRVHSFQFPLSQALQSAACVLTTCVFFGCLIHKAAKGTQRGIQPIRSVPSGPIRSFSPWPPWRSSVAPKDLQKAEETLAFQHQAGGRSEVLWRKNPTLCGNGRMVEGRGMMWGCG